ncbi:hypothetical protein [Streptomyces sp. NBC_00038]|uniref:hypothetical protein n=1 Tax=Streptomyces sp. NBC_00038 TaxID=2903615 RepID=UPI00225B9FCA|nr:hypothetical protein [Streptomyces sp. NBC_00038]MCX5555601.1 hypothetical protein [Streptomyces sp. NBC_00038]
MTDDDGRGSGPRPSRAGACVRAGMFALVGSVLAAFGHHAVAEGPVPWRLVIAFGVAQFIVVWPIARRHHSLPVIAGCTLAAQGALHLVLTWAGGTDHAESGHTAHSHMAMSQGDGHTWHHASSAMTAVHVVAALAVAWLLHRADAAVTAALVTARTVRGAAVAVIACVRPWFTGAVVPEPPAALRLIGHFELPSAARTEPLEHALVRRGPPGREHVRSSISPGPASACPVPPARSSLVSVHAPVRPRDASYRTRRRRRAHGHPGHGRNGLRPRGG